MKKVLAVLLIMAVCSTAVFAVPLSIVSSRDPLSREVFSAELSSASLNDVDDLFADIHAAALTDIEAEAVEGEGWLSGLLSAVVTVVKIAKDVATQNYVGAVYTAIIGGRGVYSVWNDPTLP
jgi:hypothetical protein